MGKSLETGGEQHRRLKSSWILVVACALILLAVVKGVIHYVDGEKDSWFETYRTDGTYNKGSGNFRQDVVSPAMIPDRGVSVHSPKEPPTENRPLVVHEQGYAGSHSCVDCHAHEHATWHASYHRTMTQVATPATVVGDFDNVLLSYHGTECRLYRHGNEYRVEIEDSQQSEETGRPSRVRTQIVQTTGSHHFQSYWYPSGKSRKLTLLPFSYRIDEQRWMPLESAFLTPPNSVHPKHGGRWNINCCRCHSTGVQPRIFGPDEMDTRVAELGISCEACHGPAAQHISSASDGNLGKQMIVHPAKVSPHRSTEICGQCHGILNFHNREDYSEWLITGLPYRPGDELASTQFVVSRRSFGHPLIRETLERFPAFIENHFWSDGQVRVSGREYNGLVDSPCYTSDDESGSISCLSCHSLHKAEDDDRPLKEWADDMLKPGMRTNLACVQCHTKYDDDEKLVQHTHHQRNSAGSNCYNCHMSYTTYGLLKAIRSHTIEIPSVQSSLVTGRPNACNQCHLDRTLKWTAEHLQEWYDIVTPKKLSTDEQKIAASVLWSLRGDAGQRALAAWSMGWPSALDASGTDWLPPYLATLLKDDYDAVRFIAHRSLRQHPGFEGVEYDFLAPPNRLNEAAAEVMLRWKERAGEAERSFGEEILINAQGALNKKVFDRLLQQRDNRFMYLAE